MSGLRAEEFGDLIFLDHGLARIGDKTFGFLILLDGATSHLTAYPCNSTSPSEVIAELHEWMDTFQMNQKAICAVMAFYHPHDTRAFYRRHNVKRIPTGAHTPWPNRAEMGVRLFKKFSLSLGTRGYSPKTWTILAQITPAQLMRKAATVRNTQVTFSGKTPMELATHLEVQQREDIRRDLAERMKFFLRTFVQENMCLLARRSEQDPARTGSWKVVEGGNLCSQGPHGCCQYRCDHISSKQKQAEETVGHCGCGRTSGLA